MILSSGILSSFLYLLALASAIDVRRRELVNGVEVPAVLPATVLPAIVEGPPSNAVVPLLTGGVPGDSVASITSAVATVTTDAASVVSAVGDLVDTGISAVADLTSVAGGASAVITTSASSTEISIPPTSPPSSQYYTSLSEAISTSSTSATFTPSSISTFTTSTHPFRFASSSTSIEPSTTSSSHSTTVLHSTYKDTPTSVSGQNWRVTINSNGGATNQTGNSTGGMSSTTTMSFPASNLHSASVSGREGVHLEILTIGILFAGMWVF